MTTNDSQTTSPGWIRRNWKILVPAAVILGVVGAWLFFGFFGFHTLFVDDTVEEAAPVFESGAVVPTVPGTAATGNTTETTGTTADADTATPATPAPSAAAEAVTADDVMVVETLAVGEFIDRSHPSTGTAVVLSDGSEIVLRLEDFETDNGPDLNVYLSTAEPGADASEFDDDFVDLGDLKGNIGSQNYEVPAGTDVARYRSVVIWCVRFGVAFGAAPLDAPPA